jgi:hypothetical protein
MKRIGRLATRFAAVLVIASLSVLMLIGMTACFGGSKGSVSNITDSDLVGTWVEVDIDNAYYFESDGSGREVFESDTYVITSWYVSDNHLYMDFVEGPEDYDIGLSADKKTLYVDALVDYTYEKQ